MLRSGPAGHMCAQNTANTNDTNFQRSAHSLIPL
jgi:hypothetical protein